MGRGLDGFLLLPGLMRFSRSTEAVSQTFGGEIARGKHLFPFRTEPLSLSAPMVLGGQPPGRVGRRRSFTRGPSLRGGPFSSSATHRTASSTRLGGFRCEVRSPWRRLPMPRSARGYRRDRGANAERLRGGRTDAARTPGPVPARPRTRRVWRSRRRGRRHRGPARERWKVLSSCPPSYGRRRTELPDLQGNLQGSDPAVETPGSIVAPSHGLRLQIRSGYRAGQINRRAGRPKCPWR
jgi:hypothetical protein